jgi:hypothetical protein
MVFPEKAAIKADSRFGKRMPRQGVGAILGNDFNKNRTKIKINRHNSHYSF